VDLRRQLGVLRSWAIPIIVGTVLAAVAAYVLSSAMPKVWESETRLLVGRALRTSSTDVDQFTTAQNLAATYGQLATSDAVLLPVMEELGISETVEAFVDRVSVSTNADEPFIDILARGDSDTQAAAIANSVAAQVIALARSLGAAEGDDPVLDFIEGDLQAMQTQIEQIRAEIARLVDLPTRTEPQQVRLETLEDRLVSLRSTYATFVARSAGPPSDQLRVVDPAEPATGPASPRTTLNIVLGAIVGLLVVVALAFLLETIDDRVKSAEDVERVTDLATIGTIMRMPGERGRKEMYRLATLLYPRSPAAEAFRMLRTNLEFASLDQKFRSILVTSSVPHEGKTIIASNIAVAYAQSGRRVILIDADLRRPGVQNVFGIENGLGLTDLARSDDIHLEDVLHETEVPTLRVLTAGTIPANPAELLGSQRMKNVLESIEEQVDLVVIDTAPVGAVTDAAVLAAEADATVFVIRGDKTSERVVRRAREALANVNAHVVGAVLNDISTRSGEANPYYGAYTTDKQPAPAAAAAAAGAGASEARPPRVVASGPPTQRSTPTDGSRPGTVAD
jgi:capsular exopolysaccharide synthesis family protein